MKDKILNGLLCFPVIFMLFVLFPITAWGIPHAAVYTLDIVVCVLFFLSTVQIKKKQRNETKSILFYIGFLLVYTFIVFLMNGQSILFYMWGLRNTFRFFAFFVACVFLLKTETIAKILKILEISIYVNVVVCSYQFWVQKLSYDNICGLFGVSTEGSGYMNVLLIIVTAWVTILYLKKKTVLLHYLATVGSCVYISAISELKAYYFELAVITVLAFALYFYEHRKLNRRLLLTIVVCVVGMASIAVITVALNPEYWKGFFLPQGVWEEITRPSGYSASGDLNRLTAIPDIFINIFHKGPQSVFGFGLGNCDYSNFDFLTTSFYREYQDLHYVWIHAAFLFLELGFIGIFAYMGFFLCIAIKAWSNCKKQRLDSNESAYNQLAGIVGICCIFLLFYNISLRMEAAYMIFFVLSIPYATVGKRRESERSDP